MQHHLLNSTKHVSGITTASEGLQRIQNMSFADKRKFIAHLQATLTANDRRTYNTISKDARFNLYVMTHSAISDKGVAKELILRNSLQKAFQSF